mmetsp:Transcript_14415/g.34252  ORF Transcript_14415/g.34252 Transcript_14415/m.34252 type:complete len:114 (+) Transcript_14415:2885-3226(+)
MLRPTLPQLQMECDMPQSPNSTCDPRVADEVDVRTSWFKFIVSTPALEGRHPTFNSSLLKDPSYDRRCALSGEACSYGTWALHRCMTKHANCIGSDSPIIMTQYPARATFFLP